MLDLEDIRAQIEVEREWRESELRFLKNRLSYIDSETDRKIYRKSLVVMLYSHFEGVSKAILFTYVNSINASGLLVEQANEAISAASLADVFQALRDPSSKCRVFKKDLPDDAKVHRFARDKEFLVSLHDFYQRAVSIDVDSIVDTESNLKPVVLRKILFRLGLEPSLVDPWTGTIQHLLRRRNDVAHGSAKDGIDEDVYCELEHTVVSVVDDLVRVVSLDS
ncbi:MAE_28990/MAE_18760 family HEPN-like nuclease [Franzmannia qiaohouensis]|uniref:MAE_28990/MAE_18760 family HEPN-like nuclease n=1 Tax=Franzmannia qiaohouensis TaxID=1329370 RepID=A0ABU1HAK7_9GAMM|nr:MAE_28990/MAE_18760 family HEPN-like nuclease [Halomonas qiaohouensis]MDR5904468.1 MAE_28990/MAE_18760 family HEPN-like nuclease [Halomonas qiaohouensis]